jgi:hypothetical protein
MEHNVKSKYSRKMFVFSIIKLHIVWVVVVDGNSALAFKIFGCLEMKQLFHKMGRSKVGQTQTKAVPGCF